MSVKTASLTLSTRGHADIQNITGPLTACLGESGLQNGILTVFCPSSTSALTTIEYEPGVVSDLKRLFDEIIPADRPMLTMQPGVMETGTAMCAPPC